MGIYLLVGFFFGGLGFLVVGFEMEALVRRDLSLDALLGWRTFFLTALSKTEWRLERLFLLEEPFLIPSTAVLIF